MNKLEICSKEISDRNKIICDAARKILAETNDPSVVIEIKKILIQWCNKVSLCETLAWFKWKELKSLKRQKRKTKVFSDKI